MSIPRDRLERAFGDRFQIERELGQGGMAVVYLAYDTEENRQVALKVLLPELGSSVAGERFLKEIDIGRRLSHTHILPIYRSGQADGLLYYTMQFVEGNTLRERLDRERQLPIEDALDITREVASALAYAHRQGVVHRDIKPENIMLSEGGAVVMDFGIARALDEAGADRLTKTGLSMGTPAYMSPEQADGRAHLDGRADLYSLACVLYEMLAGHPPFQGSSTQAILSRHARDPVPPLSSARPTVSLPIEHVVHKALAKVPADRFRSANKFSVALDMAEQGVTPRGVTPIGTHPHRRPPSFWEELKRRRVYQVGVTYGIVAFGTWQVLDALPDEIIPANIKTWIIWASILGFPVALFLSWVYELTPGGIRRTQFGMPTPATAEQFTSPQRWILRGGVVIVVLLALFGVVEVASDGRLLGQLFGNRSSRTTVDLASVTAYELESRDFAVLPFDVSGGEATYESAIQELLDSYLHGELSGRMWDVTDVNRAHENLAPGRGDLTQRQALGLAAELGAGRLIRNGSVIATGDRLTIRAQVERVPTGTPLDDAQVDGPASELQLLVQELAIRLLNHGWEDAISEQELERVAASSPPALEEHRNAVRARWRGENAVAASSARQARSLQPDFGAAAFIEWVADPTLETEERAWGSGGSLSERARTALEVASAGLGPGARPTARELINFIDQQYQEHPSFEELVDGLTWHQYELGAYAGRRDLFRQLRNLQLEVYGQVEGELGLAGLWTVEILGWEPDTTGLADRGRGLLREVEGRTTDLERFRAFEVAAVLGDIGALPRDAPTLDDLRAGEIHAVDPAHFLRFGLLHGRPRSDPLVDVERAIERRRDDQITTRDGVWADHWEFRLAEARGEISVVRTLADSLSKVAARDVHPDARFGGPVGLDPDGDPWWYLTVPIRHALYEPGWDEAAAWAVGELESRVRVPANHPGYGPVERECWPALGKLALGRADDAEAHVEPLRAIVEADSSIHGICLAAVEALIEHARGAPAVAPKLAAFDALMRQAPRETLMGIANLLLAQIYDERDDAPAALESVYRRPYRSEVYSSLPGYLRLEGRLAAAAGDATTARHRFEHYLLLRANPDPALAEVRDAVQDELDALESGGSETGG